MESKLINLCSKYPQEEIQKQIDKVVSNKISYDFYVINSEKEFYCLSLEELKRTKNMLLLNEIIKRQNESLKEICSIKEKHFERNLESFSLNGEERKISYIDLFGRDFQDSIDNLLWLEEAFAKGHIDDLDAACCLTGYSQDDAQINKKFQYHPHPSYILTPVVSKMYEIIITWRNSSGKKPLLWYIWQAVVSGAPDVRYDLLLQRCKKNKYRQKECVDKYPELAEKLDLTIMESGIEEKCKNKSEEPFLLNESKEELLKTKLEKKEKVIQLKDEIFHSRRKTIRRRKLEDFVKHLVDNGIYDTFSKFSHAIVNDFLCIEKELEDHETYNEHAEIKRVYGVLQDKREKNSKKRKYKVHFSFITSSGCLRPQQPLSLSSFKDIFDTVRNSLNKYEESKSN